MSHTWEYGRTSFTGNSDFSGDITIVRDGKRMDVPGAHLLALVAGHVNRERVSVLEQMEPGEVLGIRMATYAELNDAHEDDDDE
jgi:hypothetical protein